MPRRSRRRWLAAALATIVLGGALAGGVVAYLDARGRVEEESAERTESVAELEDDLGRLRERLFSLSAQNDALRARVEEAEQAVGEVEAGLGPLARRIQRSVFTIRTADGAGTGWSAWWADGSTYIITASHVVRGFRVLDVRQGERTRRGEVVANDGDNDLALVRVSGLVAAPLWQDPETLGRPRAGDQVVLVGSPYGLEGSVTTGVVSRSSALEIQTDAAANPGNSGGPVVDGEGLVAGVLVSGAGENVNFAVPLRRACIALREC